MEKLFANFLVDVPQAALIWLALMAFALLVLSASGVGRGRAQARRQVRWAARGRARLLAEAEELTRYADEVTVAADRAEATAKRCREEWLAAQEQQEANWRLYEETDVAVRRLAAAAALPVPQTPQTPAEYADRERYLHRAAQAACLRGELSVLELSDVMAHRGHWDPRRHPVEQELFLRRNARDGLLGAYLAAGERERAAWRAAEIAAASAHSLRQEALMAAEHARQAWSCAAPRGAVTRPVTQALSGQTAELPAVRPAAASRPAAWRAARAS